jgi:tetratricopeptide (TPR) repeat protein
MEAQDPEALAEQKAAYLLEVSKYELCAQFCRDQLALYPGNLLLYRKLFMAYFQMNKGKEARETAEQMLRLFPEEPISYVSAGQLQKRMMQTSRALAYFQQARMLRPDSAFIIGCVAITQLSLKHYQEAIQAADEGLQEDPTEMNCLIAAARAHMQLDMHAAAGDHMQELLKHHPDSFEAHAVAGEWFKRANMTENAIEHFSEAMRIEPERVRALAEHDLFLLEHFPTYYQANKDSLKKFLLIEGLFIAVALFAMYKKWQWVLILFITFMLLHGIDFAVKRENFFRKMIRDWGLNRFAMLVKLHQRDLLEYLVAYLLLGLGGLFLYLNHWIIAFKIFLPLYLFLPYTVVPDEEAIDLPGWAKLLFAACWLILIGSLFNYRAIQFWTIWVVLGTSLFMFAWLYLRSRRNKNLEEEPE